MSERYTVENVGGFWQLLCDGKKLNGPWSYWENKDTADNLCDALNSAYEAGRAERATPMTPPASEPVKPVKPVEPTGTFNYPGYLNGCRDPEGKHDEEQAEKYLNGSGRFFMRRCPCPQCDRRRARKMELRTMAEDKAQAKHDRKYRAVSEKPFLRPRRFSLFGCVGLACVGWYYFYVLPKLIDVTEERNALRARVENLAKYEEGIITEYVTDTIHPNDFGGGITRTCGDTSYKVTCEYPNQVYGPKLARSEER